MEEGKQKLKDPISDIRVANELHTRAERQQQSAIMMAQ